MSLGFDKTIPSEISEYEIYDVNGRDDLEKVASIDNDMIPEGFEFDPDYLYLWVRIISAGEYYGANVNADYFPEEELLNYYETFNTANVFKNHENKKVENAIGQILSVRWNPVMKCVEILKAIDRKQAPEIARGFEKGYLTDVSMGCKVPYTVCSVCGNKARRAREFCEHVKKYRNQYLDTGERVFEINYEPKFHDSSAVLTGAERVAKAIFIIDAPPENASISFRKVASQNGKTRFIRLTDKEMEKVASSDTTVHPLLRKPSMDKVAGDDPVFSKIAELEKEITGKLLNVATSVSEDEEDTGEKVLSIVKFLTEKRFDETALDSITTTLKELADSERVPVHQVFSTFMGIAELMGIELFPNELHHILSGITDAGFDDELRTTEDHDGEVFPSDYVEGMNRSLAATEQLPEFPDPSALFEMYNEGAYRKEELGSNPLNFLQSIRHTSDLDGEPSTKVVRVLRSSLEPFMSARSQHAKHLLPRLSVVLGGHRPLIGDEGAKKDLDILSEPNSLGDLLAAIGYRNYQRIRPGIKVTRLVKLAQYFDDELEKTAALRDWAGEVPPKKPGVGYGKMALMTIPAAYGASAFQKNRRDHDRYLSDAENFIADKPGIISAGAILAGVPLSRKIGRGLQKAKAAPGKFADSIAKDVEDTFNKRSEPAILNEMVKLADTMDHGEFNAFDSDMMESFMKLSGLNNEETAALKVATLYRSGGMEKEANEIMGYYDIPSHAPELFMKHACDYTEGEIEKAAEDFTNSMIIDSIIDQRSLGTSLPGRAVDAFIFKQLANKGKKGKGPDFEEPFNPNDQYVPSSKGVEE